MKGRDGRDKQYQACWKYPAGWVKIQLLLLLMCFQVTELFCKGSLHHLIFLWSCLIFPNCWFTLPETWRVDVRYFFSPCHPLNRDVMCSSKTPCISSYIITQNGKKGNLIITRLPEWLKLCFWCDSSIQRALSPIEPYMAWILVMWGMVCHQWCLLPVTYQ